MSITTITSIDALPPVKLLLLEGELTKEEKKYFLFAETYDNRIFCLIDLEAPDTFKKRAQTLRAFSFGAREVSTYYVLPDLLIIFRDQISFEAQTSFSAETELDCRLDDLLLQAVKANASDIHFDIYPEKADIKLRIHGVLTKVGEMNARAVNRLVNYIYNVAAAEGSKDTQYNQEEMQDALLDRFLFIDKARRRFKIRIQTAPCYPNAITIVMRVLPVDTQMSKSLEDLGYSAEQVEKLYRAQMQPSGATVVAGTTGSGKSTTLACMLTDIYRRTGGTKKILTAEDPPEYAIPGANQINLSIKRREEGAEVDMFVKAIKVAMRCDPDVIMVGEVRDVQSSTLLSSAVLSGHQVFTTVHAASALSIFDRLANLGFDRQVLTSPNFISLLMYQVLIPISCSRCKIPMGKYFVQHTDKFSSMLKERLEKALQSNRFAGSMSVEEANKKIFFANDAGCISCRNGFVGRTVAAELVEPDEQLLNYFRNEDFNAGYKYWRTKGGQTALEHAMSKVFAGQVDPREVEDCCGLIDKI